MNFSNFKVSFSLDTESFTKINYRPFIAGMIAVFVLKIFTIMGVEVPIFRSPVPETIEQFDVVKEKLMQKNNNFTVQKSNSLIPAAYAAGEFDNASGYIVFDLTTGEVIADKNMSKQVSIASITKVMTAVVALDLASPEDVFTINEQAASQIPTKIGVVVGEKMTLEELLKASLLTSANDATEAIKEGIDAQYGEEVFIKAMNEKAELIGMKNSSFTNVQGFDNVDHYSTPEDLAILMHYALTQYPEIRAIVKMDYDLLPENTNHKQFDLYNWNGLLGVYPGSYGVKIGNTGDAGVTTAVAAERGGTHIGVVLLGTPGVLERDLWASQLLDRGFEAKGFDPIEVTEEQLREKYATWEFWN